MTPSYDKNTALVVLPAAGEGRIANASLRSWLARSDLLRIDRPVATLASILVEIGRPVPPTGTAALRMWGQTGDRPTSWIAAADPIYLEPRLDRLCLHALEPGDVEPAELALLVNHLQATLGGDCGFACIGDRAYLTSEQALATAAMAPQSIDGQAPDGHLPTGRGEAAHRRLLSEIEMALHEHAVNLARQERGRQPVNSLWIWGGGHAPEQCVEPHPPLFADDPLLAGYWQSQTAVAERWPGSIDACLGASVAGFVASLDDAGALDAALQQLRDALRSKRLDKLILLFRDGLRAEVECSHALRVWRRRNALLDARRGAKP